LPVARVDDFVPKVPVPGPITSRLIAAFAEDTGLDYRAM